MSGLLSLFAPPGSNAPQPTTAASSPMSQLGAAVSQGAMGQTDRLPQIIAETARQQTMQEAMQRGLTPDDGDEFYRFVSRRLFELDDFQGAMAVSGARRAFEAQRQEMAQANRELDIDAAKAQASGMQAEAALRSALKPTAPTAKVQQEQQLAELRAARRRAVREGDAQQVAELDQRIEDAREIFAGGGQTINVGGEETTFNEFLAKQLGTKVADRLIRADELAGSLPRDMASLQTLETAPVLTGQLARPQLFLQNAIEALTGLEFESTSETERFIRQRARETATIIQEFGAGTGLSDADREFANDLAAGNISMTEAALRKIIIDGIKAKVHAILSANQSAARRGASDDMLTMIPPMVDVAGIANLETLEYDPDTNRLLGDQSVELLGSDDLSEDESDVERRMNELLNEERERQGFGGG